MCGRCWGRGSLAGSTHDVVQTPGTAVTIQQTPGRLVTNQQTPGRQARCVSDSGLSPTIAVSPSVPTALSG